MKNFFIPFFTAIYLFALPAMADTFVLSDRTVREFKRFSEISNEMNSSQNVANVLLGIAPFRLVIGKPDIPMTVEIAVAEWESLATASSSLNSHFKSQLKTFAQLEALAQQNSRFDYRFWLNVAEAISRNQPYNITGSWDGTCNISGDGDSGGRRLHFTANGANSYTVVIDEFIITNGQNRSIGYWDDGIGHGYIGEVDRLNMVRVYNSSSNIWGLPWSQVIENGTRFLVTYRKADHVEICDFRKR